MSAGKHTPVLAAEHTGMRVDYSGMLKQAGRATKASGETLHAFMLEELQRNLQELGQRYYAGDIAVVDEFLQLYCVERDARAAIAKATGSAA